MLWLFLILYGAADTYGDGDPYATLFPGGGPGDDIYETLYGDTDDLYGLSHGTYDSGTDEYSLDDVVSVLEYSDETYKDSGYTISVFDASERSITSYGYNDGMAVSESYQL